MNLFIYVIYLDFIQCGYLNTLGLWTHAYAHFLVRACECGFVDSRLRSLASFFVLIRELYDSVIRLVWIYGY